jgi:23S rRNA (cytosine1962-C5)-methyltransferase
LHALAAGAGEVTAVDSSRGALKLAAENAKINGMTDRFQTVREGAIDFLKKTHRDWDMVISDPPAFIKSRSLMKEGSKGYIDLNRRALRVLKPDGLLVTCSCSHHLDAYAFEELLGAAARQEGRQLRLLDSRGQGTLSQGNRGAGGVKWGTDKHGASCSKTGRRMHDSRPRHDRFLRFRFQISNTCE